MCWWRAASSFEKSHCISNWPWASWTLALSFAWECFRHSRNPNSHLQKSACHTSSIRNRISTWVTRGTMRDHSHLRLSQSTRSPGSAGSLLDHSSWGKAMAQYVFALLAISFLRCIAFEFDATLKLGWWRGMSCWFLAVQNKMSSEPHHPLKSQGVAGSKGRRIVSLMQILFSNPGLFSKHLMSEDSLYNVAHKLSHDWMIRSRFFGGAFDTVVIPGIACIDDHWMNIVYPSIHVNPIIQSLTDQMRSRIKLEPFW